MKNTMLQISIPQPCHEDWQAMTPATKGHFCDKCMKNVVDFTTKTDREILEAYTKDAKLCGRFKADQLNRDIEVLEKKSTVWLATTSAIMTLVGVESSAVLAQEKPKTEQHKNFMLGKMIAPVKPQTKVIKGVVSDNVGPIPGANVVIKGSGRERIWASAYNYIVNNSKNTGFGNFEYYAKTHEYPHNIFLEVYIEIGIIGALLMSIIVFLMFNDIYRLFSRKDENTKLEVFLLLSSLYYFGMAQFSADLPRNMTFFYLYALYKILLLNKNLIAKPQSIEISSNE